MSRCSQVLLTFLLTNLVQLNIFFSSQSEQADLLNKNLYVLNKIIFLSLGNKIEIIL